jgi:hypothetical protein
MFKYYENYKKKKSTLDLILYKMYMFKYYSNCQKTHMDSQHFNSILLKNYSEKMFIPKDKIFS